MVLVTQYVQFEIIVKIKQREYTGSPLQGIEEIFDKIYRARGVKSVSETEYLLKSLLDYRLLKDIDRACHRLHEARVKNHRVIVIGDYDVDGATATTVMVAGLRELGLASVDFIIPNRITDGYGLTPKLVDKANSVGCDLIITVDNGIVSFSGIDHAKALGIDVLVTDHHLAADTVPDAIIINPNQPECEFPSKCIAGVGVAFYVLVALRAYLRDLGVLNEGPNLLRYLDLVALGTVADCVKLDFNNRIMISHGLVLMRSGKARPGISALLGVAKRNPTWTESDDMGFAIAPRLNAAGRLEDMTTGVRCLLADNAKDAKYYAMELDKINQERRSMQADMTEEALNYINSMKSLPSIAVVIQPSWHEGIIGLVASMIKERFNIPSIVLTQDEDKSLLKGSCRSIPGLNIRDVLAEYDRQYPGSLVKFGGHAMAAGLTLKAKDADTFISNITKLCESLITEDMLQKHLLVDGSLPAEHRTLTFAKEIIQRGPWGNGFEKPIFYNTFDLLEQYIVGGKHLKVVLGDAEHTYNGIYFNIEEAEWPNERVSRVECAYHVQVNEFNHKRTLQLLIVNMNKV